jgi:hypothetical protein
MPFFASGKERRKIFIEPHCQFILFEVVIFNAQHKIEKN